ncbi:hypothetical protein E3U43_009973 [Larimichthys crocea]|uniref:Uncharacterized protein n=1 Tax=Larimichthys crocea TaxID=215358 RepID=A0ACD3QDR0_LARCR|nr:hypothetical protein E3U43_009973 [Larimichthys crocea]
MVGLNVSPHSPKVFLFLFISPNPSEFKSLLSQKGKKNETVLCVDDDRKLYCDMLLSWLWEPHGCTSLCLCRKGRKERKEERKEAAGTDSPQCGKKEMSSMAGLGIVMRRDRKRESTGEKLQE